MGVAQFKNPMAAVPSALRFSGEGDLFPVSLFYDDVAHKYAKGGLVSEAKKIRSAGRYGDTETVHINKEELDELTEMWGPPSINPDTGMPEFFLKKVWKKVKKIAKPLAQVAQIALPFVPGIGPLASIALSAGLGGVTGGLKGAIGGGLTGAMGAGLGGKLGSSLGIGKLGGNMLLGGAGGALAGGAKGALGGVLTGGLAGGLGGKLGKFTGIKDPRIATALGNGLVGGVASGIQGGDPLLGALATGGVSYATKAGMPQAGGVSSVGAPTRADLSPEMQSAFSTPLVPTGTSGAGLPAGVSGGLQSALETPLSLPQSSLAVQTQKVGSTQPLTTQQKLLMAAPGLAIKAKSSTKGSKVDPYATMKDPYAMLPSVFSGQLPPPNGLAANLGARSTADMTQEDWENYGYGPGRAFFNSANGYARGGQPSRRPRKQFAVEGVGTGRSDDIPAALSDGEYVMDAETVALLGDGSNKAGAQKLDAFRVNVRKHKGKKLAKGKFSLSAKKPEAYMSGGRV